MKKNSLPVKALYNLVLNLKKMLKPITIVHSLLKYIYLNPHVKT
jgi:hypothetical protein